MSTHTSADRDGGDRATDGQRARRRESTAAGGDLDAVNGRAGSSGPMGTGEALQRRYGNRAIGRLLARQADGDGLTDPAGPVESAADETARAVLGGPAAGGQRGRPSGGSAIDSVGRDGSSGLSDLAASLATATGGRPLGRATRTDFEGRFGTGFGSVRVHDGSTGARVTRALDAQALAAGEHLYFGHGEFAPETAAGRGLLAHELAHVTQFRAGQLRGVARWTGNQAPPTSEETGFGTGEEVDRIRTIVEASLLEVLYEQSEEGGGPASVQPQPGHPSDIDRFLSLVRARIEEDYPPEVTAHVDRKLDEVAGITARFGEFTLDYLSAAELLVWFLSAQPEVSQYDPVSYGVEQYARYVGRQLATYLTFTYGTGQIALVSDEFGIDFLRGQFANLLADWGNPARLVELELEGVLAAIVQQRRWLAEAEDEATRRDIRAGIAPLARQALLLNQAAEELREIGDARREDTALDRELEGQAPTIDRITSQVEAATADVGAMETEEATLSALGDQPHLLGRHEVDLPAPLELTDEEARAIEPEEAFPETTGRAMSEMREKLADRLDDLSSQVVDLRANVVPQKPSYTLNEFAGVYRNWVAFYSPEARKRDPAFREMHTLFSQLSMVAGWAGGPEGGWFRLQIQEMIERYLLLPGASADFATEIERADVGREDPVGGTATAPRYEFAEQFAGTAEPGEVIGEERSRQRALSMWMRKRTSDVEQTRARSGTRRVEQAVREALITPEQASPLIALQEPNRERWNYLLSTEIRPDFGDRGVWVHEQRGMPPEVARYLLAAEQLAATRRRPHVPMAEHPAGGEVPIGPQIVRQGGLEAIMDRGAGGQAGGSETPGIRDITTGLIEDFEAYIEKFIDQGTGAERIAATYLIASAEYAGQERFEQQFDTAAIAKAIAEAVGLASLLATIRVLGGRLGYALSRAFSELMQYMGVRGDVSTIIAIAGWFDRTAEVESFHGARTMGYVASDLLAEIGSIIVEKAVDVGIDFATAGNRLRTVPETRDQLLEGLDPVLRHEMVRAHVERELRAELEQVRREEAAQQASDPAAADLSSFEQGLVERYAISLATRSPDRQLKTDVEGRPQRLLETEFLQFEDLVGSDGRFQLTELEAAYGRYVGRKGSDAVDRREWATRQTSGRPREILEAQLGPDYARRARSANEGEGSSGVLAHHRGYWGETLAQHALAAEGHEILIAHAGLEGVTNRGIDIVTIKDGRLYLIDNKAQTAPGTVQDASSLTENLDYNVENQVRPTLARIAGDESYPEEMRETVQQALAALDRGDVTKAVTAANVAPDVSLKTDVSSSLGGEDVEFIDLMGARDVDRSRRPRTAADLLTSDGNAFRDDELEGYYTLYRERMENLGGEIMSRQEWAESL